MICVKDAILAVKKNSTPITKQTTKLVEKSCGYILAKDIYAPINMPPFRQSAMDGYAIHTHSNSKYKVIGEIKAGDSKKLHLNKGEAVRIFTGAMVPDSSHAVIMQEKVSVEGSIIHTKDIIIHEQNIRPLGEQVKKGTITLKKDTKITPATVGYLYSLGINTITVYKKPSIAIVTTGDELVAPGKELKPGEIYESNSKMLKSALYGLKFYDIKTYEIKDNYSKTEVTLESIIKNHDLVIISGGISVGKYDFVGKALHELKVKQLFYKVKQKPGKPLFYGVKDTTQIFGLPGNPAAALTSFYIYVYIALQNMAHNPLNELSRVQAKTINTYTKKEGRSEFLKATYNNGYVEILNGQNSAMQQTFAVSNALVFLEEDINTVEKNDFVTTILLPV